MEEGRNSPGFRGAYLAGSILWLSEDAALPASSDVDLFLVLSEPPLLKLGKLRYREALLDVSYTAERELKSAERVLGQWYSAPCFSKPNILVDATGQLTELQAAVSKDYARRQWVRKRCEQARGQVIERLDSLQASAPFHEQVAAWLFGTSVTTVVLLVAGLENPTVRRRYLAARELLAEHGRVDFYECLIGLLGCGGMTRPQAEQHLAAVTEAFDVAKSWVKTPYRFASDISDAGRPIGIDGSRELIERGHHREAVFYLLATYSRCQHILCQDAPIELQERHSEGYRRFVADLGIVSYADLQQRCEQVKAFLPRVWEVAEMIMRRTLSAD